MNCWQWEERELVCVVIMKDMIKLINMVLAFVVAHLRNANESLRTRAFIRKYQREGEKKEKDSPETEVPQELTRWTDSLVLLALLT